MAQQAQNGLTAKIVDHSQLALRDADKPLIIYNASRNLVRNVVSIHYFQKLFTESIDRIIEHLKKTMPEMLEEMKKATPNIRGALKEFGRYFAQQAKS